ncbi:MAG: hypothetical protein VXY56_01245 [Pseudomonadota bacterium]|nr:hypothetical protein [Pseudomonadota bacterium]
MALSSSLNGSMESGNVKKENRSLFDSDFAQENAASFTSLNSNNNNSNKNPFTGGDSLFNESELRYEPLRKVQDADKYRSGGPFTSLLDPRSTDEPLLNSFLDSIETRSSQHNNG